MTERDKDLPQQQDKPEGGREEETQGLSDAPMAPLQTDQAEGEREDVDDDVKKLQEAQKAK